MADHFTFIVSGGRTGTQFLGDLMSEAIDDCHSEHEPDVFHRLDGRFISQLRRFGLWHMVIGRTLGLTGIRVLGTRLLTGASDLSSTTIQLRRQRRSYHESVKQGLLVESSAHWWMVAPYLRDIFPNSNVFGIVRDPRGWIESRRAFSPPLGDLSYLVHMLPPGPLTPKRVGDENWATRWDTLNLVGRWAWTWKLVNTRIAAAAESGIASIYRFEDIFDPGTDTLYRLCSDAAQFPDRSFGVRDIKPLIAEKRNASTAQSDAWQRWSNEDKTLVNEICGPLMERFGYKPL